MSMVKELAKISNRQNRDIDPSSGLRSALPLILSTAKVDMSSDKAGGNNLYN